MKKQKQNGKELMSESERHSAERHRKSRRQELAVVRATKYQLNNSPEAVEATGECPWLLNGREKGDTRAML